MDVLKPAAGAAPPSRGRPRGRPKGSRNKATNALVAVLEGAAEALVRTLIDKALAGDGVALRFCVGLILPARRDRPVVFDLPEIESAGDLVKAARALLAACAKGIVSPEEAKEVMDLIAAVQALEKMGDVEKAVIALERRRQALAAKNAFERAAHCNHGAARPARVGRSWREAFAVSGCESAKGIPTPRPAHSKSPVFNSPTRGARGVGIFACCGQEVHGGWAQSARGACRFGM
jgi:hypothetical protein